MSNCFFDLIDDRVSCREFKEDAGMPKLDLEKIVSAAEKAPSAGNLKSYGVMVLVDPQRKDAIGEAANGQDWLSKASAVLVFMANPSKSKMRYGKRGEHLFCIQDATLACAYAQLAANSLGYDTCWVGSLDESKVLTALGLESTCGMVPVALLPIGIALTHT
jgi:nitroreductase